MENYSMPLQVRWSDLDPNFHLRHSVYYDWAAMCRIAFLNEKGLTPGIMQKLNFGPIILREECVFRKEIKYGDVININLTLLKNRSDYSRWTFRHKILKNDKILCAVLTIDGAWMNMIGRKLFIPTAEIISVFEQLPRDKEYQNPV